MQRLKINLRKSKHESWSLSMIAIYLGALFFRELFQISFFSYIYFWIFFDFFVFFLNSFLNSFLFFLVIIGMAGYFWQFSECALKGAWKKAASDHKEIFNSSELISSQECQKEREKKIGVITEFSIWEEGEWELV